jgi:hypothetical protein
MTDRACEGAETRSVRTTEHMEECRVCKTQVRADLVEHPFFGFASMRARCHRYTDEGEYVGDVAVTRERR